MAASLVRASAAVRVTASAPKANKSKVAAMAPKDASRRSALLSLGGAAGLFAMAPQEAKAAYGEAANVWGSFDKTTALTNYLKVTGEGYEINIPQKGFNPAGKAAEAMYPNVDVMWIDYESTDYAQTDVLVFPNTSSLPSADQAFKFFSGTDVYNCDDASCTEFTAGGSNRFANEQGFTNPNGSAHLLKQDEKTVDGVKYKVYDILQRYADGSVGGRYHLISAAVKNGKLYVGHFVGGEKHWIRNEPIANYVRDTFRVL